MFSLNNVTYYDRSKKLRLQSYMDLLLQFTLTHIAIELRVQSKQFQQTKKYLQKHDMKELAL